MHLTTRIHDIYRQCIYTRAHSADAIAVPSFVRNAPAHVFFKPHLAVRKTDICKALMKLNRCFRRSQTTEGMPWILARLTAEGEPWTHNIALVEELLVLGRALGYVRITHACGCHGLVDGEVPWVVVDDVKMKLDGMKLRRELWKL